MTEERGLIGNWLTWPRYTWSHNISHPSCIRSLMHFSIRSSKEAEPFHSGVSPWKELRGWSHVASQDPTHHFKETGWGWSLHDGCSFPSCECLGSSCTSYLSFMCRCPATDTNTKTHWCQESRTISAPSFPRWMPGFILWSTDCVCWMQYCARFHISYLIDKNVLILLQCIANAL